METEEGIVQGQAGVRLAEVLDHPFSWVVASWGPAYLYRIRGEFPHAVRFLERALALCREWDLPQPLLSITAGVLASVVEKAESHYRQAMGLAEELGVRPLIPRSHSGRGKLYKSSGRPDQAQTHLNAVRTMFREMVMRSWLEQAEGGYARWREACRREDTGAYHNALDQIAGSHSLAATAHRVPYVVIWTSCCPCVARTWPL